MLTRAALILLGTAISAGAQVAPPSVVRIDGSTGVMPLVTALADAFRSAEPSANVIFGTGLGSGARIEAVRTGRIDIALASHGLVVADLERLGLLVWKIADVPVGFAVHNSVAINDLTESQVCDIYAGRITNWKQLGGADLAIAPATRPKGEVDGDVVRSGVACMTLLAPHASVVSKALPEDMTKYLSETPGAIGMTTTTVAGQSNGRIRIVSLASVRPTPENVLGKRYTLTRESFLVTRSVTPIAVTRFLDFIQSDAGARVISASGAIPR